jgi:hypothetical protein
MQCCKLWRIWILPYVHHSTHVCTSGFFGDYQPQCLKVAGHLFNRLIRIEPQTTATLCVLFKSRYNSSCQDPWTPMHCHIMSVVTTLLEESWKLRLEPYRFEVAVRVPSYSKMTTITSHDTMWCPYMTWWHGILLKTSERYFLCLTA